jgi:hypothetical protein
MWLDISPEVVDSLAALDEAIGLSASVDREGE